MKTRQLPSQQRLKELLDYNPETGILYWRPRDQDPRFNSRFAGKEALTAITHKGYRRGLIEKVQYRAHRVAYKWFHGEEPEEVDHINGIRTDNRIKNLRACSRRENMLNSTRARRKARLDENNVCRTTGGGWQAKISHLGVNRHLGVYNTKEVAQGAVAGALALLKTM